MDEWSVARLGVPLRKRNANPSAEGERPHKKTATGPTPLSARQ
jgi:hypothetical protein